MMDSATSSSSAESVRLDGLLRLRASSQVNRIFLEFHDRKTTYGDADRLASRAATRLASFGVGFGDRVVVCGENSDQFVIAVFAVMRRGAIVVPVSIRTAAAYLRHIVISCHPRVVVSDQSILSQFRETFGDTPICTLETLVGNHDEISGVVDENDHESAAVIIYTSGSTAAPRGVVCPHRAILVAVRAINQLLEQRPDDRILCVLPFSFDYGLYQAFLALEAGATLVIIPAVTNPLTIPAIIKSKRISGLPAVPALASLLLRSHLLERIRFDELRYFTSTGDLFPTRHVERLRGLLPGTAVLPMYGLTECKRVAVTPITGECDAPGSVGVPLPISRVEIKKIGNAAIPGAGELFVFGPHLMSGYWEDPEATLVRYPSDPVSGERMLRTGDVFRQSPTGHLYFLGRQDAMMIWRDREWHLANLEDALTRLNGVDEAAVLGCGAEDNLRVYVFLVRSATFDEDKARRAASLLFEEAFDGAPPLWTLNIRQSLPRTINGKVDREQLRANIGGVQC